MNTIRHIGVIMDGNRRWARKSGLLAFQGHDKGADVFVNTCDWCIQENISYLTVYAFSTENWKRPTEEINHIFDLFERFFKEKIDLCIEKDIKFNIIGERTKIAEFRKKTLSIIEDAEKRTKDCKKLNVQMAFSYGGRDEIVRAIKKLANDIIEQKLSINDISEKTFPSYLDTAEIPERDADVDLVIRTGGTDNRRLSNFLPWQTVYSELYFSDFLWPEFSKEEFDNALSYYHTVKRRKGE